MCLSIRLKQRRKELGITQVQLAERTGMTQQAVNRIEKGFVSRPRFLLEIAQVLKCEPEWLLKGLSIKDEA
ncbi:helix-turn-helix domain-containing protein [Photorhabdus sp. SF281]|uniref:helix-turn-helix domain-containing protein n=1 Tax=Photorhabdus sp. SF281 TaxID=3459527 RepID=UPI0040441CA2